MFTYYWQEDLKKNPVDPSAIHFQYIHYSSVAAYPHYAAKILALSHPLAITDSHCIGILINALYSVNFILYT